MPLLWLYISHSPFTCWCFGFYPSYIISVGISLFSEKVILLRRIHFKMNSGLYFPKISNNYLSPREYSCFIAPLFVETVNSHFCPSPPFSWFLLQAQIPWNTRQTLRVILLKLLWQCVSQCSSSLAGAG